jgi:glutamyl/glutaminyl-tRNA synthetase
MENRLESIKEKVRVYDKYLGQTDLDITEEDLSDLYWLIDKVERYEKTLKELTKSGSAYVDNVSKNALK